MFGNHLYSPVTVWCVCVHVCVHVCLDQTVNSRQINKLAQSMIQIPQYHASLIEYLQVCKYNLNLKA